MTKRCSCCRKILPVEMFSKHKLTKDKLHVYCKPCQSARNRLNGARSELGSIKKINPERALLNYTDIRVEEGKMFASSKDFIKFKRKRLQSQKDKI